MDKFDKQKLFNEIDMLEGNINRMCVTTDSDELWEMQITAFIRFTEIAKMCDLRMKELKESENKE